MIIRAGITAVETVSVAMANAVTGMVEGSIAITKSAKYLVYVEYLVYEVQLY